MFVDESNFDRGWIRVGDRVTLRVITSFDLALFEFVDGLARNAAVYPQKLAVSALLCDHRSIAAVSFNSPGGPIENLLKSIR